MTTLQDFSSWSLRERKRMAAAVLRRYALKMDGLGDSLNAGWARRLAANIESEIAG